MNRPPTEPHGDIRQVIATWRQIYVALLEQDFTPAEALAILQTWIATANPPPGRSP